MTNDEIKLNIDHLLDSLAQKEKKFLRWRIVVSALVFTGALPMVFLLPKAPAYDLSGWVAAIAISFFPAFAAGAIVFWAAILPEEKRLRDSYITSFSSKETRVVANRILAEIPANERNLKAFSRLRRKLGVILRRFKCHACGTRVKIEHMGQHIHCPHCNIELVVPLNPQCPYCAERNTRVISPEEQVAPIGNGKATAGGGLIYGPVGLIAGGILDAIYRPFKLGFRDLRVATKAHVFHCDKCLNNWAITLLSEEGTGG